MSLGLQQHRTRFILRHGIVPWGIVAGVCAAIGSVIGLRNEAATDQSISAAGTVEVALLCFALWCFIAGWVVGAIRWHLREPDEPKPPPRLRQ